MSKTCKCSNETCLARVQDLARVVGDIGEPKLIALLLAASGDVNRAINHFLDGTLSPPGRLPHLAPPAPIPLVLRPHSATSPPTGYDLPLPPPLTSDDLPLPPPLPDDDLPLPPPLTGDGLPLPPPLIPSIPPLPLVQAHQQSFSLLQDALQKTKRKGQDISDNEGDGGDEDLRRAIVESKREYKRSRGERLDDSIDVEDNNSRFSLEYSEAKDNSTAVERGRTLAISHKAAMGREQIDLTLSPARNINPVHKTIQSPPRHSTRSSQSSGLPITAKASSSTTTTSTTAISLYTQKNKIPCSISKEKSSSTIPDKLQQIADVYKFMESDGYPITFDFSRLTNLTVELREYQKQTVSWMIDHENKSVPLCSIFWRKHHGKYYCGKHLLAPDNRSEMPQVFGGILCEEMGLGKTVETIALMLADQHTLVPAMNSTAKISEDDLIVSNATLIVCPVSILSQWMSELGSKVRAGTLRIFEFHGKNQEIEKKNDIATKYDVVITTYTKLARYQDDILHKQSSLHRIHWRRVILDEAHIIKDGRTSSAKACARLHAKYRWAVTGTPFRTSIQDIAGIFEFLHLVPLPQLNRLDPLVLRKLLRRLVMRHSINQELHGNPLLTLPPRHERIIKVDLSAEERDIYTYNLRISAQSFATLASKELLEKKYAYIMANLIVPLRQICCGMKTLSGPPRLDLSICIENEETFEDINKMDLEEWRKGNKGPLSRKIYKLGFPECPICMEIMETPSATPCSHLFCKGCIHDIISTQGICPMCRQPVEAKQMIDIIVELSPPPPEPSPIDTANKLYDKLRSGRSSKLTCVLRETKEIIKRDPTSKIVIFTQWSSFLHEVQVELRKERIGSTSITGGMGVREKSDNMQSFQANPLISVFLLSIRAGAVGMNLTAANHLFLLDPVINKGLELQAISRVFRIGQTRETIISHFIAKGTVEEKIFESRRNIQASNSDDEEKVSIADLGMLLA